MNGVFLDTDSVFPADLDLTAIEQALDAWEFFSLTSESQRLERVKDATVIISNKVLIDATVMDAAPQLKLIAIAATGYNNVDLKSARARNIAVTNVCGYGTETVAQHCFALILALAANLHNYREDVRNGTWSKSPFFCLLHHPITELSGKTLGIIGYGAIGQAVARIGSAMGMKVVVAESIASDRKQSEQQEGRLPLPSLIAQSDVLSLHCPLTPETQGLIDSDALAQMKSTAFLINTSRGGLVDEAALLSALNDKQIAGAALDVLETEPPGSNHPLIAQQLPNLILTPHCAWGSRDARQRLIDELALNINAFLRGEPRNRIT